MQLKKTDNEIKQQVLRELKWDSRIGWSEIGVEVMEGVVTLTGLVSSYAKKLAAQEAAHRISCTSRTMLKSDPTEYSPEATPTSHVRCATFSNGTRWFLMSASSRRYRTAG